MNHFTKSREKDGKEIKTGCCQSAALHTLMFFFCSQIYDLLIFYSVPFTCNHKEAFITILSNLARKKPLNHSSEFFILHTL